MIRNWEWNRTIGLFDEYRYISIRIQNSSQFTIMHMNMTYTSSNRWYNITKHYLYFMVVQWRRQFGILLRTHMRQFPHTVYIGRDILTLLCHIRITMQDAHKIRSEQSGHMGKETCNTLHPQQHDRHFQTTCLHTFMWLNVFCLKFHWNLFLLVQSTPSIHRFG